MSAAAASVHTLPAATAFFSVAELGQRLRRREFTSLALTEFYLERLRTIGQRLNLVVTLTEDLARRQARDADEELRRGRIRGPLHGIPYGAKDLLDTAGIRTTWGCPAFADRVPSDDATVIARLREAGAVLVAKLAMIELAGAGNYRSASASLTGPARNPWNPKRWTGGSSSGPGGAVAGGLVGFAIGSETWGSIVNPSTYCGIAGLRPTYGRVSRAGAMPLSFSLDTVGPLAQTVRDCALIHRIIAGPDPEDPTALDEPVRTDAAIIEQGAKGLRIAVPTRYFLDGMSEETSRLFAAAADVYRTLGADIVEVAPPGCEEMSALATIILACEASTVHGPWYRERKEDYSGQVRARIELGFHHPATAYLEALMLRARHLDAFGRAVFAHAEAMLAPVLPFAVPTIAETDVGGGPQMGRTMALLTRCSRPVNYLGLPSLTVPSGFTSGGLPFGVQIIGRPFAEETILRIGRAFERETDWAKRRPPLRVEPGAGAS